MAEKLPVVIDSSKRHVATEEFWEGEAASPERFGMTAVMKLSSRELSLRLAGFLVLALGGIHDILRGQ